MLLILCMLRGIQTMRNFRPSEVSSETHTAPPGSHAGEITRPYMELADTGVPAVISIYLVLAYVRSGGLWYPVGGKSDDCPGFGSFIALPSNRAKWLPLEPGCG